MRGKQKAPGALRRKRLVEGYTLREVARELERICRSRGLPRGRLSRGELSRIERGKRWPSAQQAVALAQAYGVAPGTLCEWILEERGLYRAPMPPGACGRVGTEGEKAARRAGRPKPERPGMGCAT